MNIFDYMLFGILFIGLFGGYSLCVYLHYLEQKQNPWHNYQLDPPPKGEEIICYNKTWTNFNSSYTKIGYRTNFGFMYSYEGFTQSDYPEYWMKIPENKNIDIHTI